MRLILIYATTIVVHDRKVRTVLNRLYVTHNSRN